MNGRAAIVVAMVMVAGGARADECDVLAARVVERTGATLVRRDRDVFHLSHPYASEMSVTCDPSIAWRRYASMFSETAYPSTPFFDAIAAAGNIMTGLDLVKVKAALARCQKAGFRDREGDGQIDLPGYQVTCSEAKNSGSGYSNFQVFKRPAAR